MVFLLDNYILVPFFLLLHEMGGFPNKWCENRPGICVFLDFYDVTHETVVTPPKILVYYENAQ